MSWQTAFAIVVGLAMIAFIAFAFRKGEKVKQHDNPPPPSDYI